MSRAVMQQARDALERLLRACDHASVFVGVLPRQDAEQAMTRLDAALAEQKCPCGDRPADQCPGEWEPGCDLGANEKHAKVATADASLGAAIEAIDAALAEQAQPTSEAGWLHRLDMEKSEAWMAGYAQGQKRAAEQAEPVAWMIWLHGPVEIIEHKQFAELELERLDKMHPNPARKLLPLYTTPPAPVAPPGWRMVPVEPTQEMTEAAGPGTFWIAEAKRAWRAMLAAAPEAPAPRPLAELPPLPPEDVLHDLHDEPCPACNTMLRALPPIKLGYTADQMRDYARAVEAETIRRMGVQR